MHLIRKYFNDQKWTLVEFEQAQWTKHSNRELYYLGNEKNERGIITNCKGVEIRSYGAVMIGVFDQTGYPTRPYIKITEDGFEIRE